jgi:CBS domain containing-hemolysin-like protein
MSTLAGLGLLLALCLTLSTLFTALESAYRLAKSGLGGQGAPPVVSDDVLHALILGNLAANFGAAASATLALPILTGGPPAPWQWAALVLGLTLVLLIPCEAVPASVGARRPAATIRRWEPWLRPWLRASRPAAALLTRLSSAVRAMVFRAAGGSRMTPEDVRSVVEKTGEHLELEREERDMVHSIFTFGETVVREVMVPRPDMLAVEEGVSFARLMEVAREAEHSRLPVYRGTLDSIVGIVYVKDLLARRYGFDGREGLEGLLREPFYVPESKKIDDLLREFQQRGTHIAIVGDEYGGTAGLVTIEDILEEIVGEIQDEHDTEEPPYVEAADGTLEVDARMNLDDFSDAVGVPLAGEGFETVGGLVYTLLGRVPEVGEEVTSNGLVFRVERLAGRRIQKLRVSRLPQTSLTADSPPEPSP